MFYKCSNLSSITFLGNVTQISSGVFLGCSSLKTIDLPETLTTIGGYVFEYCSFKTILIPENVDSIGYICFGNCINLESITIPQKVVEIDDETFSDCNNLRSIEFQGNITVIGSFVFGNCHSLESISFPNSLTSIYGYAFYNCSSLKTLIIPENVNYIDVNAFGGCESLNFVLYLGEKNPTYGEEIFFDTDIDVVYVTPRYQDNDFCSYNISLIPTAHFSETGLFSPSEFFSETCQFSESSIFSPSLQSTKKFSNSKAFSKSCDFTYSNEFTKSKYSDQIFSDFEESSENIENTNIMFSNSQDFTSIFTTSFQFTSSQIFSELQSIVTDKNRYISYTLSLIASFIRRRSVSFSYSITESNSFYLSYLVNEGVYSLVFMNTNYNYFFPYIIYYLSQTCFTTYVPIYIKRKRLTAEQLIGITCGSAAIFFSVLAIIIFIIRKKYFNKEDLDFSISEDSLNQEKIESKNYDDYINNSNNNAESSDSDIDFWL